MPCTTPNTFDDVLTTFWKDDQGKWIFRKWRCTTDPGLAWLKDPNGHSNGTAQIVPGQHIRSHRIGLHKGQYEALVQNKPIPVFRDRDRDNILDPNREIKWMDAAGINIHHAGQNSTRVDRWSAGCIVVARLADWAQFQWCYRESAKRYGPVFSLTVLEKEKT